MTNKANFDYLKEAAVTVSHDFHGELVSREHFFDSLTMCITHLKQLDRIKKSLFYGKEFVFNYHENETNIQTLPSEIFFDPKTAEYIIHAIIGVATEAGELLEALHASINGENIDLVNLKEEQGDSFWYHALLASICGVTFEEIQQTNIAKLRSRYPDKFTAFDACNRDLAKEREILEHHNEGEQYYKQQANCADCQEENPKGVLRSKRGFAWLLFAEEAFLACVERLFDAAQG